MTGNYFLTIAVLLAGGAGHLLLPSVVSADGGLLPADEKAVITSADLAAESVQVDDLNKGSTQLSSESVVGTTEAPAASITAPSESELTGLGQPEPRDQQASVLAEPFIESAITEARTDVEPTLDTLETQGRPLRIWRLI